MKLILYTTVLFIGVFCTEAIAQQQSPASQPLEYIESSSPLPGGGVVTSISVPGQSGPTYNTNTGDVNSASANSIREASLRQPATGQQAGQSVLDRQLRSQPGSVAARQPTAAIVPQRTYQVPPTAGYGTAPNAYQVPLVASVPSLGVPATLNRALRPNCTSCAGNAQGYGGVAPPSQVYAPAASLPPTLGAQGQSFYQGGAMVPPRRSVYTPVIQLRNMPPNVYAGQGIIGSPKLYVDGQPVRNLIRYLVIP